MSQDEWNHANEVFSSFDRKNIEDYPELFLEQTLCC